MYDLSVSALERLDSASERMVVQRWIELTADHTHPEWRLSGTPPSAKAPLDALMSDLRANRVDRLYHAVRELASALLLADGQARWQFNAVRTYLLGRAGRADRPFSARVEDLAQVDRDLDLAGLSPEVVWEAGSAISIHGSHPWVDNDVPSVVPLNGQARIVADAPRVGSKRIFRLRTAVVSDDPRHIAQGVARLHFHGSLAVDFARLTISDHDVHLPPQMGVERSARLSTASVPAMPRMSQTRLTHVADRAYSALQERPSDMAVQQVIAGLRWLSVALARWRESPVMAATICYMALDAAHNGCVTEHRRRCRREHESALDLYTRTLRARLADELESYLLRLRGTNRQIKKGQRNPPAWLRDVREVRREDQSVAAWSTKMMKAMSGFEHADPLLRFHFAELRNLNGRRLETIRERCSTDLDELRKARNELVHDTGLLLAEQRTSYLAALAIEMLLITAESSV